MSSPMTGGNATDESITAHKGAHVNVNRLVLPKSAWELIVATVMAASLIGLIIVSYLLHDAYKDIQTQVWVRQDKDEEKFQKFIAGPYAQLAGEIKAVEILSSQCSKTKEKSK